MGGNKRTEGGRKGGRNTGRKEIKGRKRKGRMEGKVMKAIEGKKHEGRK